MARANEKHQTLDGLGLVSALSLPTGTKKARAQASTSHSATSARYRSVLWSLAQCNPAQSELSAPPVESFFVGLPAWARIQTQSVWVHPHGTVPRLVSPAKAQGHTEGKEHPSQLWRACSALAAPPIPPQACRSPWSPNLHTHTAAPASRQDSSSMGLDAREHYPGFRVTVVFVLAVFSLCGFLFFHILSKRKEQQLTIILSKIIAKKKFFLMLSDL